MTATPTEQKRAPKTESKTHNEEGLAAVVSEIYSIASGLRRLEWGKGSRQRLDHDRHTLEKLADELRVLHLAFPLGPEYIAAQKLAAARDEWDLCKKGVVAFHPDTFAGAEFFEQAHLVPEGYALVAVAKWNTTNMEMYQPDPVGREV